MNNDALDKYRTFYTVVFLLILSMIFAGVGFAAFQKGYVQEILFCPDERETNINQILPEKNLLLAPSRSLSRITDRRYYPEENYLILPNRQIVPGSAFFQEPATADQVLELYQVCQEEGKDFLYVLCPGKPISDDDLREYGAPCFRNESADAFVEKLEEYEIPHLDLRETIMQTETPYDLFYMTDHHWTADAGLIAARRIAETLNERYDAGLLADAIAPQVMQREVLDEPFVGETGKKLQGAFGTRDHLVVWTPSAEAHLHFCDFQRNSDMTGDFNILFDPEKLGKGLVNKEGNVYYYYMSGNHIGYIENADVDAGNILVIKDSMSCVVTPYLALTSGKVTFWDMRKDKEVVTYLRQHPEIRTVVVMYNISSALLSDMNAFS